MARQHFARLVHLPEKGDVDLSKLLWLSTARVGSNCYNRGGTSMTSPIEIDPSIMLGKPVVRNTRIPVELLLRKLAEGSTFDELLDSYPRLTKQDIQACLEYKSREDIG